MVLNFTYKLEYLLVNELVMGWMARVWFSGGIVLLSLHHHIQIVAEIPPNRQPSIQWALRSNSLGIKQPEYEDDESCQWSVEVWHMWSFTSMFLVWLHSYHCYMYELFHRLMTHKAC